MRKVPALFRWVWLLLVLNSPAFSISFTFTANPWGGSFNFSTNTGTVLYTFTLESLDPGESFVGVEAFFGNGLPASGSESPIITSFSFAGFLSGSPPITIGPGTTSYSLLFQGPLSVGQGFQFLANLTLSQSPFDLTLPGGEDSWSSMGPFAQSYTVYHQPPGPFGGPSTKAGSMGLAPEPATVMLLGTGILSFGLVERFRKRKRFQNKAFKA